MREATGEMLGGVAAAAAQRGIFVIDEKNARHERPIKLHLKMRLNLHQYIDCKATKDLRCRSKDISVNPPALYLDLLAVSAAVAGSGAVSRVPLAEVTAAASRLTPAAAGVAVAAYFAAHMINAAKLRVLLPSLTLWQAWRFTMIGVLFGTALPGQLAGDAVSGLAARCGPRLDVRRRLPRPWPRWPWTRSSACSRCCCSRRWASA